jgi:hypothetical protein
MRPIFSVLILLLLSSPAFSQKNENCCKTTITSLPHASLKELSKEFQRLKKLKEACCSNYSGDLRLVMEEIGKKCTTMSLSDKKLIRLLGKPDAKSFSKNHGIPYTCVVGESVLIYHWRSWHDYLYIIIKDKHIKEVKWFYAYE